MEFLPNVMHLCVFYIYIIHIISLENGATILSLFLFKKMAILFFSSFF